MLLVVAAILGVPISVAAYFFLWLITHVQQWVYTSLPNALGFHGEPIWWPVLPLLLAGIVVGLTIRYLPGRGGHSPADGFKAEGGPPSHIELPGVLIAAFASIALGAVIGPEAPLIALGGGLAALALWLVKRDAPAQSVLVVGAAGSFAAISFLLGNPLLGAIFLLEAMGLGGPTATLVLLPGLLAGGIGFLVFIGIDTLTGLGVSTLSIPDLPPFTKPDVAEFGWAIVIAVAAVILGSAIRWLGLFVRPYVERRLVLLTPLAGLTVAGLAIAYAESTGKSSSDVLFSGQTALPGLIDHSATYSVGALLLLMACKGLAYGTSLGSFRGGPTFPAMFIGAAGGIALSHLPGLPLVAGVAMGIGAMTVVMLRLPIVSVLLATLLLLSDGLAVMPLVIVAVVVAFVLSTWLQPWLTPAAASTGPTHPGEASASPVPDTPASR
ncbi:MAG TPA: chloride channel protein [Acidimicrobiia bacterium]|nr:chloride channel protein [Acidimicrobiia bacterium]